MTSGADRRGAAITVVAALAAGLLVGVLGTFKHQFGVSAATGAGWPIGLAAGLATVTVFLIAIRLSFPSRWPVIAAGVGVLAGLAVLLLPGPSGQDLVVLNRWTGIAWRAGVVIAVVCVALWPRRRQRPADAGILEAGPLGGA